MSLGPDANPHKHHHFDLYPRNNHAAELKVFPAAGAGRMPRSLLIVLFAVGALFAAGQLLVHWLAALPRLPARGVAHPEPAGELRDKLLLANRAQASRAHPVAT